MGMRDLAFEPMLLDLTALRVPEVASNREAHRVAVGLQLMRRIQNLYLNNNKK